MKVGMQRGELAYARRAMAMLGGSPEERTQK